MNTTEITQVRPYSTKDLSRIYGVSDKTLRKWLKPFEQEVGKRYGHYYTIMQVEVIFNRLGKPYRITEL